MQHWKIKGQAAHAQNSKTLVVYKQQQKLIQQQCQQCTRTKEKRTCGVMKSCTQPWKLSAVESSRLKQQPTVWHTIKYVVCPHKREINKKVWLWPTVLTAEEKKIATGAANPDHLLNSSAPPALTALLPTSKHTSAPITTPVQHHSSSTVVYSL